MMTGETEFDMALRHVREGQAHIDRQRGMIERLEANCRSSTEARALLATFEHTQALHRQHLARLMAGDKPGW